jgi:hypothetical protein
MNDKIKIAVVNASNKDIQRILESNIEKATRQTRQISGYFKGPTEINTCYNIWNFLKTKVKYKEDTTAMQDIKLPSGLLRSKVADCKSFSLFTVAILKNLGIPCFLTYTSYNEISIPSHVYVTTKSGIIIDGVWSSFNSEKKPTYKKFVKA